MTRSLSALTVFVAAVAVLSAADATARSACAPKLVVASTSPVVVIGTGFEPRETVRVVVRADDGQFAKSATATAMRKITMRFATLTLDNCEDFVVVANGNKGSTVRLHRVPPACGIDQRAG
jgi:hypothetical protein